MVDYNMVKTYRDIYHANEAFRDACHAGFPIGQKNEDVELTIFIEQEAMYQQLETCFYPCRSVVS